MGREDFSLGGQEKFLHVFLANAKAAAGDDGYDLESGFAARRLFGAQFGQMLDAGDLVPGGAVVLRNLRLDGEDQDKTDGEGLLRPRLAQGITRKPLLPESHDSQYFGAP